MLTIKIDNITRIRQEINACFNNLKFDEESHSYTLNNKKLISTTTYLKRFSSEFEPYLTAKRMADSYNKKRIATPERSYTYYLYRWKHISEAATNMGSAVHNYAEYNYPDFIDSPSNKQEQGVIDFFNDLDSKYVVLFLELRMYIEKYLKAGTADIILYNKDTGNIVIADWKTNGSNLHQVYNTRKLKEPFSDLWECDLNKYSLQLSDYKNMIELNTNYKVEDMWIIHLDQMPINQLSMGKSEEKFTLDLSNEPISVKQNYKLYSVKDYSKELLTNYEQLHNNSNSR
jgi:hypothetical protein